MKPTPMKLSVILLLVILSLTGCNDQNISEKMGENNLAAQVEYGDKMVNKVVFDSDYKMIVFALKKGQDLKPHSAPMDAPLLMLEGSAKVTIGDEESIVYKGDIITLPKDVIHGLYPINDCKFLLIK